jgi:hypothetical protein
VDSEFEGALSAGDQRSGFQSVRGPGVGRWYSSTGILGGSNYIGGYAYAEGSKSQRRGRAWFGYRKRLNESALSSFSSHSRFHHYRTEMQVFVGGVLRSSRTCYQSNTCQGSTINSTRHVTTKARFCGDYKNDNKDTLCTAYSVVTRY